MKYKITYDETWKDVEYVDAKSVYTGQGGTVEFVDNDNYTVLILSPLSYDKVELIKEHKALADIEQDTEPLVTKTGRVLSDQEIQDLADEAERGYDVETLQ